MLNLDGGHYFFTAAVPVCNKGIVEHQGMKSSPIHMVREALETLPTALQSHAAEEVGIQSPFARSTRTHFARFIVLDQPAYNGRDHTDAVLNAIDGTDLLKAQPHDVLACPYLLVAIDFDPTDSSAGEPRAYFEHLWGVMAEELKAIFAYCYGFGRVRDAASFADFILPCQIETTMPFNDYYWTDTLPLTSMSKLGLAAIPVAGLVLGLVVTFMNHLHWWLAVPLIILLAVAGVVIDYWLIMRKGGKPFPASGATLPLVLKSLYLQQAFARFAAGQQDGDPASEGAAFRAFLQAHRPNDLAGPTQPPGVIRTSFSGAAA